MPSLSTVKQMSAAPPEIAPKTRFCDLYFEEYAAAIALLFVVASVSWGVITRYVSHTPAIWTGETARIAFAWAVFLGSAAGFKRREHIVIDVFLPLLPPFLARMVLRAADLIVLVVLVVITVLSVRFTISTYQAMTTVLRLPQSVIYGAAAVGFALMTLRHIQAMRSGRAVPGASATLNDVSVRKAQS